MPIKERIGRLFGDYCVNSRGADSKVRFELGQQLLIDFGHVSILFGAGGFPPSPFVAAMV
jgi:hypothetical protein